MIAAHWTEAWCWVKQWVTSRHRPRPAGSIQLLLVLHTYNKELKKYLIRRLYTFYWQHSTASVSKETFLEITICPMRICHHYREEVRNYWEHSGIIQIHLSFKWKTYWHWPLLRSTSQSVWLQLQAKSRGQRERNSPWHQVKRLMPRWAIQSTKT